MAFLLDTTVLVDVVRGLRPTVRWLASVPVHEIHTSVISVGELHRGAWLRHPREADSRDAELRRFEQGPLDLLRERILAFDRVAAEIWGRLAGERAAVGRSPSRADAQVAAIALRHELIVATSNLADFVPLCPAIDPRTC